MPKNTTVGQSEPIFTKIKDFVSPTSGQNAEPIVSPRPKILQHHPDVSRYRMSTTDKCLKEMRAADARIAAGIIIGSREYMEISATCNKSCGAKYHWCPTCFIAPRCDCMLPHFSPSHGNSNWFIDQLSAARRLTLIPCDNRYWSMTNEIRSAVNDENNVFCEQCISVIHSKSPNIAAIHGRTYLEQAHQMWKLIMDDICPMCITTLDKIECGFSSASCPSNGIPLITDRLISYQPRKYHVTRKVQQSMSVNSNSKKWNESVKIRKPRPTNLSQRPTNLSQRPTNLSPRPSEFALVSSDSESTDVDATSSDDTVISQSDDEKEFAIIQQLIASVINDDDAPIAAASLMMNEWYPSESEDDELSPLTAT